jgi:polyprenyl-phospho-N-acetylgalactosaminyl synthase
MKNLILKSDVWICIPAYNEESAIENLLKKLLKLKMKIVVVNDGSTDLTQKIISQFPIYQLNHKVNLGKGSAMKTGSDFIFQHRAKAIIFMDADGQHSPENISDFILKLQQGNEIIFGRRSLGKGTPFIRLWGNKFASLVIAVFFGIRREDLLCGFIAMTKKAYETIQWDSARYGVETEIVAKTGTNKLKYSEVSVEAVYCDKYKGVTVFDALGIMFNIPGWFMK